jgi:hypothetical protein
MTMNEQLLAAIEDARQAGAVILVKWDGGRTERVCTVMVTDPLIPFHFREDTDDVVSTLTEALRQFSEMQTTGV